VDSGYDQKFDAQGRVRLLRRFGDMETKIEEVLVIPAGTPKYNNAKTMKHIQSIRSEHPWNSGDDYN
jgi:homogentisate 1,2-dioxygenase